MPLSQFPRNYIQQFELADRTLDISDAFKMLYANNGALKFTVPPDIFGEGVQISLCDFDGGVPEFQAGVGVTLNTSGTLGPAAQFTVATIIRAPTDNVWIVVGNV